MGNSTALTLDERIARIKTYAFAANDAIYDLLNEVVLQKVLPAMNEHFGERHIIVERGGGGQNGSDTTALLVKRPRPERPGRWNRFVRWWSPYETVILLSLSGGRWECHSCVDGHEYKQFAANIDREYREYLSPKLWGTA